MVWLPILRSRGRTFSEELAQTFPTAHDRRRDMLELLDKEWSECQRCPLGQTARHHCLYDRVPDQPFTKADLMVVGEGPGEAEDTLGKPFKGPSGRLLRETLLQARAQVFDTEVATVLTNLVACRPFRLSGHRRENREPSVGETQACSQRLKELLGIFRPTMVVAVGKVADTSLGWIGGMLEEFRYEGDYCTTYHPAYVLRKRQIDQNIEDVYVRQWIAVFERMKRFKEDQQ